jgi:hypothetical protein
MNADDDSVITVSPDVGGIVFYDPVKNKGFVMKFLGSYANDDSFFWDRAGDNKFYFKPDLSAYDYGDSFSFTVRLYPFTATAETWVNIATTIYL